MSFKWIDISIPIHTGMVHWPGDPGIEVRRVRSIERGDVCNLTKLDLGAHTGTHMDAPLHFIAGGRGMEQLPLDATLGRCRVLPIKDRESIKPAELEPFRLKRGERILFKTLNSRRCWKSAQFDEDFVYISKEAAQILVDRGVRTVGVDYLSIGGFKRDGVETHRIMLGAGIWVIEGLNLAKVKPGRYELVCLPLKIVGADGAPARAVVRCA